jgi:hypothetical protein
LWVYEVIYFYGLSFFYFFNKWAHYVGSMWFIPYLSTLFIIPLLSLGKTLIKYIDQGWVEYLGGQGVNKNVSFFSSKMDYFYILNLKSYLLIFFMFLIFLIIYL